MLKCVRETKIGGRYGSLVTDVLFAYCSLALKIAATPLASCDHNVDLIFI